LLNVDLHTFLKAFHNLKGFCCPIRLVMNLDFDSIQVIDAFVDCLLEPVLLCQVFFEVYKPSLKGLKH
jgi:hypothetical protein